MSRRSKQTEAVEHGGGGLLAIPRRVGWFVLAGGWLITALSVLSFSPYDPPSHAVAHINQPIVNWCGPVGALIAYQAYLMLGIGVWVILAAILPYLCATALGKPVPDLGLRLVGLLLMAISISGFMALTAPLASALPEGSGGLVAIAVVDQLTQRFAALGTGLILMMAFGVGAMLAADQLILALPGSLASAWRSVAGWRWPKPVLVGSLSGFGAVFRTATRLIPGRRTAESDAPADDQAPERPGRKGRKRRGRLAEPLDENDEALQIDDPDLESARSAPPESQQVDTDHDPSDAAAADPPSDADTEAIREKIKKLPITVAALAKPAALPPAPPQDLSGYRFPDYTLLEDAESNFTEQMARLVRDQAEILERALKMYRIDGEVVAIDAGPVITLYEVQLAPGTKVSAVNAVSSDLARELKAPNIRIVANTAGKSTVGIEVPNLKKEKVRLKELMALTGRDRYEKLRLPMFLGKDASGNVLLADLADMPHMLIAGTTGSGKSVCINSIIMSFLYTRRPDELKMVLVDPKMVEMAQFKDIPHLMCPVVTEMSKAAAILEWAVTKMEERYSLLADAGVRDIDGYNALSWDDLKERFAPADEQEEAHIPKKLARMVFVIDELADMILTHKEVEGFIVRIAQKARAVGIHLILATQRPQANVVTGLIKSNMPCRVSFKVASGMDSRIVLDSKGAELLLGQGDMLYLSPKTAKLQRSQGTLVDDAEVRRVVRFLKTVASQSFEPQLIQLRAPGMEGESLAERDPLFDDAVRCVLESKRGSVSLLQRRLGVGYGRASKLIEEMATAGIIGEYKGTVSREVNITIEEWEELRQRAEAEAAVAAGFTPIPGDDDEPTDDDAPGECAEADTAAAVAQADQEAAASELTYVLEESDALDEEAAYEEDDDADEDDEDLFESDDDDDEDDEDDEEEEYEGDDDEEDEEDYDEDDSDEDDEESEDEDDDEEEEYEEDDDR